MKLEEAFGAVLKKHRKQTSLSQEELAHICDLDRTFISLLERGQRRPTINTIFSLAQHLNIKPSDFIHEVDVLFSQEIVLENYAEK